MNLAVLFQRIIVTLFTTIAILTRGTTRMTLTTKQRLYLHRPRPFPQAKFWFQTLVKNLPEVVFRYRLDTHHGFDYINRSILDMTGFSPEEIYRGSPATADLTRAMLIAIKEKRSEAQLIAPKTIRWPRKDGSSAWVSVDLFPVYNFNGLEAFEGIAYDLLHSKRHQEDILLQIVISLTRVIEARDAYTADHSKRLAAWAEATSRRMRCSEDEVQIIRWGALLHDIGKISIPDSILRKAGPLTDEEWQVMKSHPQVGAELVSPLSWLGAVTPLIRSHQEWYDGSGYPDGLRGQHIPLGARILTVADAYGAMTDNRVYRRARSSCEASQELRRFAGIQFDARVVEAFNQVIAVQ
jgi:putative nucleotidyltransferase with HDIG domain/PAS domain S-box-containing protein